MERALKFLSEHKEVAFATVGGEGAPMPKLRVMQVMRQEGTALYFATNEKKAVYRELCANPNVEVLAAAGYISVRCAGIVNFHVEEEVKRWIYDHNDILSRLYESYDQMTYFCLPIAELDYYDLSPTPPLFLHFDLITGETGRGFVGTRFEKQQDKKVFRTTD